MPFEQVDPREGVRASREEWSKKRHYYTSRAVEGKVISYLEAFVTPNIANVCVSDSSAYATG